MPEFEIKPCFSKNRPDVTFMSLFPAPSIKSLFPSSFREWFAFSLSWTAGFSKKDIGRSEGGYLWNLSFISLLSAFKTESFSYCRLLSRNPLAAKVFIPFCTLMVSSR